MHRPCAIVTDRDTAFITLPADATTDNEEQKHARAAQVSGANRGAALDEMIGENPWIKAFFATHTFEVDFLLSNNAHEVKGALPQIYKPQPSSEQSEALLDSEDKEIAGREILRLAEKVGKGWFALLVSEQLTVQSFIPTYILSAIAFACHLSINAGALKRMAEYRVQLASQGVGFHCEELKPLGGATGLSVEEYVATYRNWWRPTIFQSSVELIEEYTAA